MKVPFTEPAAARYIHVNSANNYVHLLVPVVGGETISTDNTCQSTVASDEFFNGAALRELNAYKSALEFDLQLLGNDNVEISKTKQQRLAQINAYIATIPSMQTKYKLAMTAQRQVPSNLYSIQLRPHAQDPVSPVVNPVFNINRKNDATGKPLSALFNALYAALPNVAISPLNPRQQLEDRVKAELGSQPINFQTIQNVLTDQCRLLFGLTVDFTQASDGTAVNQASMDAIMGFTPENPATQAEYTQALLSACAPNIWYSIPSSPFYSCNGNQTEQLSILTQFFLAHVNIYCAENNISSTNFGVILDASDDLSSEVAGIIFAALGAGATVEESLCSFFNEHTTDFGLTRQLAPADTDAIKQRFATNYTTVKDSRHMDDFMILNTETDTGKFVTHQGSICTDFSELVAGSQLDSDFFKVMRADFAAPQVRGIPHQNEHIIASINLEIDELISRVNDVAKLNRLDLKTRHKLKISPAFQARMFLQNIAHGKQDQAKQQIDENPALLLSTGCFTDYSGRTFNCTGYEYAYWAKDTYMCRMLEARMDEPTKAVMLERIDAIERDGLTYEQKGMLGLEVKNSKHFDLGPVIQALQNYVDKYDEWYTVLDYDALTAAWMLVGLEQRELPVHMVNEYCRPERSFNQLPAFNEDHLPRILTYYNFNQGADVALFPLDISGSSGLGVDFALVRGALNRACAGARRWVGGSVVRIDLAAIRHLDEFKTQEIMRARENLLPVQPEHGRGLSM